MNNGKNKIVEKLMNILLDIAIFIFGIILLISIYNSIQVKVLKNDYSSFFGFSIFGVQTGSMADAINAGDWIIVQYTDDVKINDIITYKLDGEFITHRVIESYKETYITRGDANNTRDVLPVNKDQIVGKVIKVLPKFEILKKTLFNPIVLIALIITLYLISTLFKKEPSKLKTFEIFDQLLKKKSRNKEKIEKEEPIKKEKTYIKIKRVLPKLKLKSKPQVSVIPKEETIIEPVNEFIPEEEDLDKTICFRVISVDKSEIDGTKIKVAMPEEEIVVTNSKENEKEIKEEKIKKTLEELSKNKKKFNNFIDKIMYIKEKELKNIVKLLLDEKVPQTNYATIKDTFLESYMDGKYYNFCGDVNVEYNKKNMKPKLSDALISTSLEMIKKYKGTDKQYKDKVEKFRKIFELLNTIEEDYEKYNKVSERRAIYNEKISKHLKEHNLTAKAFNKIVDEIINIQRLYRSTIKYSIEKLNTNIFKLEYHNTAIKNVYAVELIHNIAFSKIYSDYIVDKVYTEGIVAEDKTAVLMTLLSIQIINNMLNKTFGDKYIIYLSKSLYEKDTKLDSMFDMIDDEQAKSSIITLLKYDELIKNKSDIKRLTKLGFHFAVDINNVNNFRISDQAILELVDYIFISKKNPNKDTILLFIPKILHDKVIYDDIASKIEN